MGDNIGHVSLMERHVGVGTSWFDVTAYEMLPGVCEALAGASR